VKFHTPLKSPQDIVDFIQAAVKKSNLPAKVSATLDEDNIKVTVSKFGTSEMNFSVKQDAGGCTCELVSKEISTLHKPFIADVEAWVVENVVKASGGNLLA
jgi:hypothetical protein